MQPGFGFVLLGALGDLRKELRVVVREGNERTAKSLEKSSRKIKNRIPKRGADSGRTTADKL